MGAGEPYDEEGRMLDALGCSEGHERTRSRTHGLEGQAGCSVETRNVQDEAVDVHSVAPGLSWPEDLGQDGSGVWVRSALARVAVVAALAKVCLEERGAQEVLR